MTASDRILPNGATDRFRPIVLKNSAVAVPARSYEKSTSQIAPGSTIVMW
jgi:hypothetical protein